MFILIKKKKSFFRKVSHFILIEKFSGKLKNITFYEKTHVKKKMECGPILFKMKLFKKIQLFYLYAILIFFK